MKEKMEAIAEIARASQVAEVKQEVKVEVQPEEDVVDKREIEEVEEK